MKSYQQPDDDTLLAVMNEERKVRERLQGALGEKQHPGRVSNRDGGI